MRERVAGTPSGYAAGGQSHRGGLGRLQHHLYQLKKEIGFVFNFLSKFLTTIMNNFYVVRSWSYTDY